MCNSVVLWNPKITIPNVKLHEEATSQWSAVHRPQPNITMLLKIVGYVYSNELLTTLQVWMPPMQYSSQEGAESSVAQPATPFQQMSSKHDLRFPPHISYMSVSNQDVNG